MLGIFALGFMIFSIPAGFVGGRFGRKRTILQATSGKISTDFVVKVFSGLFLLGGFGWGLVNVNSLPMVVDMTTEEKVGGYTGLYYFFSMAANIFAPPLSGIAIDHFGYSSLFVFAAIFFILALIAVQFVKRGDIVAQKPQDIYGLIPDMD